MQNSSMRGGLILVLLLWIESSAALTAEDAARECTSMAGWEVQWTSEKSLVCTNMAGPDGFRNNCNSCDTWRLFVFADGGEDPSPGDDAGAFSTKAGAIYGGHSPCAAGDNLVKCSEWALQTDSPTSSPSASPTEIEAEYEPADEERSLFPGKNLTTVRELCASSDDVVSCYDTADSEGDLVCAWRKSRCWAATNWVPQHPTCSHTPLTGYFCTNGLQCCGTLSTPRCACKIVAPTWAPTLLNSSGGLLGEGGRGGLNPGDDNKVSFFNKAGEFLKEHWIPFAGFGAGLVLLTAGLLVRRSRRKNSASSSKHNKMSSADETLAAISACGTISIGSSEPGIDMWLENPMMLARPPART